MEGRLRSGYPFVIAQYEEAVGGFGTFGVFRSWPCYGISAERSVHVRSDLRGRSIGRRLLERRCKEAQAVGKRTPIGVIDADNHASTVVRRSLGFEEVPRFREVGRIFNRWLDLVFVRKIISAA